MWEGMYAFIYVLYGYEKTKQSNQGQTERIWLINYILTFSIPIENSKGTFLEVFAPTLLKKILAHYAL